MRSDARKRTAAQKPTPPVVIRQVRGDWHAECDDNCADPLLLTTDNWPHAYEVAIGHARYRHGTQGVQ